MHNRTPSCAAVAAVLASSISTSIAQLAAIAPTVNRCFLIVSPHKKLCPEGSIQHTVFIDFSKGGSLMEKRRLISRTGKTNILSKVPLVELAGQNRVLIENHLGVLAYSLEEIQVKVCYGSVRVIGSELRLMEMNKEQLVISGRIDALQLFGR